MLCVSVLDFLVRVFFSLKERPQLTNHTYTCPYDLYMVYLHMTLTLEIQRLILQPFCSEWSKKHPFGSLFFFYVKIYERIYQTLYKIKKVKYSSSFHEIVKA